MVVFIPQIECDLSPEMFLILSLNGREKNSCAQTRTAVITVAGYAAVDVTGSARQTFVLLGCTPALVGGFS